MKTDLLQKISPFFSGWNETLIWSVLQGHMGVALADDDENPRAAQVSLGDFCFFAGEPSAAFASRALTREIVPKDESWHAAIEEAFGERAEKRLRYAIKKEPDAFSRETLQTFVSSLPNEFTLRCFDREILAQAARENWSCDFRGCFLSAEDFLTRGIGIAAMYGETFVAGASSYSVYDGGFEIEIDTHPDFRRRGLATACGAKLILEALNRNLYPSWDAFDLRSVALAEKLGYHLDHPYPTYMLKNKP